MHEIDLNCDFGESFGVYTIGMDSEVVKSITSANVGCGFHGGDYMVMDETVRLCKEHNVAVGAHPGFPDLMGFGRRAVHMEPFEVKNCVKYQIGALNAFCKSYGVKMSHVKAHGMLYNLAAKDSKLARAIAEAVAEVDGNLILLGLSGSEMINAAKEAGIKSASEVFADRAYNADGTLVDRRVPGAFVKDIDLCVSRIVKMIKDGKVTALTGEEIDIFPQSVCVHGDNPEAVAFVRSIRKGLESNNIKLRALI